MHLASAFIQIGLNCIHGIHFLSVHAFPGNRTHDFVIVWSERIREHIMFSRQRKHAKINTNVT